MSTFRRLSKAVQQLVRAKSVDPVRVEFESKFRPDLTDPNVEQTAAALVARLERRAGTDFLKDRWAFNDIGTGNSRRRPFVK
jgi:hypothetical protein